MAKPKKTYTPAPSVPIELSARLEMITEVIAGRRSVSEAARVLGMSRNHFQTILHRGLAGMVESITPQASGRPGKPKEMLELEAQLERLKRENARLQERVGTTDRLLEVASGLLQGRIRPVRQPRTKKAAGGGDEDKGESEPARRLIEVDRMRACGVRAALAARIAGVHEATVRRWRRRRAVEPRRPRSVDAMAGARASELVRGLKGMVGAEALRRSVPGISRRQAAAIKAHTLTAIERERKERLTRVCITAPGVVRGMDGMYLHCRDGPVHALIAADAAVPYRSAARVAARYDWQLVMRTLATDMDRNDAPLIYRLDRARAHDTPAVSELLASRGVLLLHGPPRLPRFYGQLERQNREHRAWDADFALVGADEVEACLEQMLASVNTLWRRRTLGWKTPFEAWNARPRLQIDRHELCEEVKERAARIGRNLQSRGKPADLALRLAIEQALESRGLLRRIVGGWC